MLSGRESFVDQDFVRKRETERHRRRSLHGVT